MDICSLLLLPSFNADNDAPPGALCTVSVTLLAAGIGLFATETSPCEHDGKDDVQTNSRIQTAVISAPQPPICITYQRWWPGSPSLASHVVNAIDGIANVMERSRRAKCSSLSE